MSTGFWVAVVITVFGLIVLCVGAILDHALDDSYREWPLDIATAGLAICLAGGLLLVGFTAALIWRALT